MAYIDSLARQQPKGTTQQEQLEDFVRTQQQRLAACRKVLALNPDKSTKQGVIQAMYEVHRVMDRLGLPGARAQLMEFAKSLAADSDPELARVGRYTLFDAKVSQIASQPLADGKDIVGEVQTLLAAERGALHEETLELASQAADVLQQSGLKDDAVATLELLAAAAAAEPKLADRAEKYTDSAKLVKADLTTLLGNVLTDQPDAESKLREAVKTLLVEIQPNVELFKNMRDVAGIMEATGHYETAKACFDQTEAAFKDAQDGRLAAAATRANSSARQRIALVGQPFVVEGVTLDGKPFDWSAYQGKVVLIDFWATWCGPCLAELPNIRQNHTQFHAKGFDVVGVNLDTDLSKVEQFFSVQELPWTTVTSPVVAAGKADEDWTQLPMAAKCGVDAIPFLVLVGKDGKVDSLHVRGPKLKSRLTQLLGEPLTTEIPADPTAPAPPAAARPPGRARSGAFFPRGIISPVALLVSRALLAAKPAEPPAAAEDPSINPYQVKPGLTTSQLVEVIQKRLDMPKVIQGRPGFADAIVDACDRVLAADPPAKEAEALVAAESKLAVLHREACNGNNAADKQLTAFVEQMKDDQRPRIAREVAFFRLERRVLDAAQGPLDQVPALLEEVKDYFAKEKLTATQLRLASSTVALVNRLDSGDEREKHFAQFGALLAKSSDKELARYGKKLAKKPPGQESDLVGQPLELVGTTAKGAPLAWESYRGKIVLVDFWATWCGPCRREMPAVKEFFEQQKDRGFLVVGVSLDQDQEALAQYLEENQIPWDNLAGDETQQLAEKYSVRAIPTLMLVDRQGKVVGVAHNLETLAPLAEKLLSGEANADPGK